MDRQYIDSRMISSAGYNSNNATLEVEFKSNGQIWQYFDVPEYVWFEFLSAESKGQYFLRNIRKKYTESQLA